MFAGGLGVDKAVFVFHVTSAKFSITAVEQNSGVSVGFFLQSDVKLYILS